MPNQHRYDIPAGTIYIKDKDLEAIRQKTEAKRIQGLVDGFLTQVIRRPLTSFSPAELDLLLASCEFADFSKTLQAATREKKDTMGIVGAIAIFDSLILLLMTLESGDYPTEANVSIIFVIAFLGVAIGLIGSLNVRDLEKKLADMPEQSSFRGVVLDRQALNLDEIPSFVGSDANTAHLNRLQQIITAVAGLVDGEAKSEQAMGLTLEQAPVFAQAVAANLSRDQRGFLRSELARRQKKVAPTSPAADDQSSGPESDQARLAELYSLSIRQRHMALSPDESR